MRKVGLLTLLLVLAPHVHGQTLSTAKDFYDSALAHLEKGDANGALTDLNNAIELSPGYVSALCTRGQILFLLKRNSDAALADYDKALELAPNAAGMDLIYSNRSVIRQLKGDRDGALKDLDKAIKLNPQNAMSYSSRGVVRSFIGDLTGAAADYDKAIELNAKLTPAYLDRAILRFQLGNLSGALADYDKALELEPKVANAYVERGIVHGMSAEIDNAIADIKKGLALNPASVSDRDPGNFSSPFTNLSQFIASHPTNARAYEARALLRLAQGKKTEAAEDFRRSLALDPTLKPEVDMLMRVEF